MSKKIVILTSSLFPYGQAYSTRLINFARLFHCAGFSVHIIANTSPNSEYKKNVIYTMENFTFEISGVCSRTANLFSNKKNAFQSLNRYVKNNQIDYIFFNGTAYHYFFKLKKFCKRNNVDLFTELCEWYDYSNFKFGRLDPRFIRGTYFMKKVYTKQNNLIVISELLRNYYSKKGLKVIRIPTILDVQNSECDFEGKKDRKIKLMYAGNPGKSKELLLNILLALKKLKEKDSTIKNKIQFDIYGVNEEQVKANIKNHTELLKELADIVSIKGKVKQQEIHSVYQKYNFSIFIRPHRLSSNAGFPTKLAESMMAGTPVISNNTGDIGLYLTSFENGFLLNDSSEDIDSVLKQIIEMPADKLTDMYHKARKTAEENFDYRRYIDMLKFIHQ